MVKTLELLKFFNTLLMTEKFVDYAPNGLQVEGKGNIGKLVSGVTACQGLIDAAIDSNADAILVHHGYFWKNESPSLVGIKKSRIKALLENDINLFAYHLPLDAHAEYGNNAQLAKLLGFKITGPLQGDSKELSIGNVGELLAPMRAEDLKQQISQMLNREPLHIPGVAEKITSVAWCTGGAQNLLELAVQQKVDAYITGEVSESTVHLARESGVHFFAAGHHATERYGVKALGEYVARKFGIEHMNIEIDNPA